MRYDKEEKMKKSWGYFVNSKGEDSRDIYKSSKGNTTEAASVSIAKTVKIIVEKDVKPKKGMSPFMSF